MNKEKISKVLSCLLTLIFLSFLGLGMAATLLRKAETFSYYENRNLATMPVLEKGTVLNGAYFSKVDTYLTEHAAGRNTVLKAIGYADMYLFKRPVVNEVVIRDDILLPFNPFETVDEAYVESGAELMAQKLKSHSDTVHGYGGEFYYVAVPCQYVCYEDSYPWYLNNRSEYTEASSTALFSRLDANGVKYIDMMRFYEDAGKPEHFSSTVDNHYSILGAYDTYAELMKRITSDTDIRPDVLTLDDFNLVELPNFYLGSRTRKLFGMWDSNEKLQILDPKEKLTYDIWNYGTQNEPKVYHVPADPSADVSYTMYMGGDVNETILKTYREELPSILIYGDSFTNPVECIAWQSFDTMYTLDYRHYEGEGIEEYINKYQPDVVVCIRDYEALLLQTGNGQ